MHFKAELAGLQSKLEVERRRYDRIGDLSQHEEMRWTSFDQRQARAASKEKELNEKIQKLLSEHESDEAELAKREQYAGFEVSVSKRNPPWRFEQRNMRIL